MTSPDHQANKALVLEHWAALDNDDPAQRAVAAATMRPDVRWRGHAPVGTINGADRFLREAWEPIRHSFPDLRREPFIFFAGTSKGRADGDIAQDGQSWVTGTGILRGTFAEDYLGIPATGTEITLRWGEFCRVTDGLIDDVCFLIDVVDLMQQAGYFVLPPARGKDGQYPPPAAGDGLLVDSSDVDVSAYSLDHIHRFIYGALNGFDRSDLTSMGMADFFDPDVHWYGPGGIGACYSLSEFEEHHQRPWLIAYPNRRVQDLDALIAEGVYSGASGWAGVLATHTGPYLGVEPTGRAIEFNGLDWWKRNGERYIENWVFVDMPHLFRQFGVDLFERLRSPSSPAPSTRA